MKFVVKRVQPQAIDIVHECVVGQVVMHITPQEDGRIWQHYMISEGYFEDSAMEECAVAWPMQVLLLLRKAADQLETRIREDQEQTYEADLERGEVNGRVTQA